MAIRIHVPLAAALLAALGGGCGESGPALVPVTGTVTLNGKPLEGATVSFMPDPSNKGGIPGEDLTGPQGNYKAITLGRSGLVPGKYKVTVSKMPVAPGGPGADMAKEDPYMAQLGAESAAAAAKKAPTKKKDPVLEKIEQTFDREIPPSGGPQDFDVKAGAAAAAAVSK
jgi:hypothetical protein